MKSSGELKRIAKDALQNKWSVAAMAALLAALMGAATFYVSVVGEVTVEALMEDMDWLNTSAEYDLLFVLALLLSAAGIWKLICAVIGGAVRLGYGSFNLRLIDGEPVTVKELFGKFNLLGKGFLMNLLMGLFTALWSLLLFVPGIVKSYAYAMTHYILVENPELSALDAISHSDSLMTGHKGKLFLLDLSFFGWYLLATVLFAVWLFAIIFSLYLDHFGLTLLVIVLGALGLTVGEIYLHAYFEAARTAFYRELSPAKPKEIPLMFE